jgi:peptide/nickel transport system permease protein
MIAVGVAQLPVYARLVRGVILSIKEQEFVVAAQAIGASDLRIMTRHVLPNSVAPIIVQATLNIASAILSAAALGFLGLGAQPPTPEWGTMLSKGRLYLRVAPHVTTFPGLAILITVLGFNLFGDGLRDALDPKMVTVRR